MEEAGSEQRCFWQQRKPPVRPVPCFLLKIIFSLSVTPKKWFNFFFILCLHTFQTAWDYV